MVDVKFEILRQTWLQNVVLVDKTMCIIQSHEIEKVADTQILAFRSRDKKHQITAYSNQVNLPSDHGNDSSVWSAFGLSIPTPKNAAMILPVPNGAKHFEMIDTSTCKNMFERIDDCFPKLLSRGGMSTNSFGMYQSDSLSTLEVKTCGSYQYTLVPSLSDFGRLDCSVFELDADVQQVLAGYAASFAFLVCKLSESKKYHPVAYKHPMPADGKLFVPTLHYHQGHQDSKTAADWDHQIYLLTTQQTGKAADNTRGLSNLSAFSSLLPNVQPHQLRKLEVRGNFPNQDLLIAAA